VNSNILKGQFWITSKSLGLMSVCEP